MSFQLDCYEVRIHLHFTSPISRSVFLGYALRGLFGRALFNEVCIDKQAQCAQCALRSGCAYPQLFKPSELKTEPARLPGYVIHDWSLNEQRNRIQFSVVVFGSAVRYLEIALKSLLHLDGQIQLAGARYGRVISLIDCGSGYNILPSNKRLKTLLPLNITSVYSEQVKVILKTPLATKHQPPDFLLAALRTRLRRLLADYGQGDWVLPKGVAWQVKEQQIYSKKITVNSHRQLNGVLGTLYLEHIHPEAYPLLVLGQYIHAGSDAAAGMGYFYLDT